MSENNIMKMAAEHLAQAEEAFERLQLTEEVENVFKSKQVVYLVDRAYDACVSVLEELTSKAPEVLAETAKSNLETFKNDKETFISDFRANFKRAVGVPLFCYLEIEEIDKDEMREKFLSNIQQPESTEVSQISKEIVDIMVMDITKDYLISTYGNIIPAEVLDI